MLRMITGYQRSQALYVAAKLGIADLLADGPKTVEELANASGAHAPSLYRLLRALASEGVFREQDTGSFELTSMAELLRSDIPGSVQAWAIMFNQEQYQAWTGMLTSIQTGKAAFDHVFGESFFGFLSEHPQSNETFNRAMTSGSAHVGPALVESYDFSPFDVVADIGGGNGRLLSEILTANPHARGILFDQPHVAEDATTKHALRDVEDRCKVVGGDFFDMVPVGADVYLLRLIMHDWDDQQCEIILQNCRRAINAGGRVLILETIVAPANEPDNRKWMDLRMLACLGGQERTEAEFRKLLEGAGFTMTRVIPLPVDQCVIEAMPA